MYFQINISRTLFSVQLFSFLLVYILYNPHGSTAAPIDSDTQAVMYLSTYGYMSSKLLNPSSGMIITEDSMKTAISEFQAFAGLNVTGRLDKETKEMMSMPRCGVKDVVGSGSNARRRRRYALQGSRWRVKNLSYRISSYPKNMKAADVDKELGNAFKVWSDYTDLTFTPKKTGQLLFRRRDRVHIDIRFARGEHGDGDPFDGPGGTLAHAYFPVYGGDAHFDESETWTIRSYRGTNLFQVAAHEFGHSLGLSHSDVRAALMAPFYRGYDSSFRLHEDDVQAIQSLYGTGSASKGTKGPQYEPPGGDNVPNGDGGSRGGIDDPELCSSNVKIDTIFTETGSTYVFKGDMYWKLTDEGVASGYPRTIGSTWPGLPSHIDAAFTYNKNSKTYFFKDSQYWRFTGKKLDPEYPKRISDGFQGIPSNVDAAMVWGGNGKIYFFKGNQFYRFDPTSKPPVKSTYPKSFSNWAGLPADGVDAALQYTNGYTYFFKKGQYYRFNDRTFAVDTADPPFPRPSGYWWFGCQGAMNGRGGNHRQPGTHEFPYNQPANGPDEGDEALDTDEHQQSGGAPGLDRNPWDMAYSDDSQQQHSHQKNSVDRAVVTWSLLLGSLFVVLIRP